jgi:hypothetical protein
MKALMDEVRFEEGGSYAKERQLQALKLSANDPNGSETN